MAAGVGRRHTAADGSTQSGWNCIRQWWAALSQGGCGAELRRMGGLGGEERYEG